MFFSRWPSLFLTVAMLVIVGICLKRIDFTLIDEVKAVISIAFGFATSCLLLSLIWILHRKPMHVTWPTVVNVSAIDAPNMNPRASVASELLNEVRTSDDRPPDYDDALINSKPISWIVAPDRDEQQKVKADSQAEMQQQHTSDDGQKRAQNHESECERPDATRTASPGCNHNEMSSTREEELHKISSPENITHLAFSIVRGFTSTPESVPQLVGDDSSVRSDNHHHRQPQRKLSYCQLDVNQLMNQGSPPKYCEFTMPRGPTNQGHESWANSPPDA